MPAGDTTAPWVPLGFVQRLPPPARRAATTFGPALVNLVAETGVVAAVTCAMTAA